MNTLLPLQTRVYHTGHGLGTIVAYNGRVSNDYTATRLDSDVLAQAVQAGLTDAIVNSFYGADRYPYVVHFDANDKYPEGYKDVYDVDDVVMKEVK